ncbi:uncharacterized protein [Coffea arabica]|uniref:Uncharacterized protein isoform X2 n=1 Tax=Coffea arabica TaxID=13443 RepID=A0ABM4WEB8_COFAR
MSPTYGRVSRRPKKQRRKSGDEIQQTKDQARREEAGVAASQIREQGQKTQANQKDMSFSQLDDMIVDNSVTQACQGQHFKCKEEENKNIKKYGNDTKRSAKQIDSSQNNPTTGDDSIISFAPTA